MVAEVFERLIGVEAFTRVHERDSGQIWSTQSVDQERMRKVFG